MTAGNDGTADLTWIRALYEFGQQAVNGVEPLRVQQEILQHIVRGFDAASGSIAMMVDGSVDELEIVAGTDLPPGTIGRKVRRGVGVFGHVVATAQPMLINDDAVGQGVPSPTDEPRRRSNHSAMCWPLIVREKIIGVLAVNRASERPNYTLRDLDNGSTVTSLLALVMANHRMHVEREQRIVELSTLNDTMRRMNVMLEVAQNQVIQADKLASIGQIAAGVAHEINNPIAFVLSNVNTLQSYLARLLALIDSFIETDRAMAYPVSAAILRTRALLEETDLDFLRGDVDLLVRESRDGLLRVKRIVQELNNFSRGGAEESWLTVDLHAALDSALSMVSNEIRHRVHIDLRYGSLPKIECRPSRLSQVFLNLLVNAGQSISGSGIITVSTGVEGDSAWVQIEDSGCGIAPEHIDHLFEPFFTTKPVGKGTGLGLSVSYAIVQKHGGRIDVDSELGHGTRFTVYIPICQQEARSLHAATAPAGAGAIWSRMVKDGFPQTRAPTALESTGP